MEQWFILDRNGEPAKKEELPERPEGSNSAEGEAFRPWYKQDEHLHIEDGAITGIHARGSLDSVRERLQHYIEKESVILEKFGGDKDVLLPEADSFLRN